MGVDILLGFNEPKVFTAAHALTAGQLVKITANGTVDYTTAITDVPIGVVLIDAASGANVVVIHACWVKGVPNATGAGVGPVMCSSGALATGGVQAYSRTSGDVVGIIKDSGTGEMYVY